MFRLSIVIPTSRDARGLEETLLSVLENCPDGSEILVPNDGSYADPYDLSDEVQFVDVPRRTSYVGMVNRAAELARGATLHILCPGVTVQSGWCDEAVERFTADLRLGSAAPRMRDPQRRGHETFGVTWSFGGYRRTIHSRKRLGHTWGPSLRAAFYRTTAFQALAGLDPSLPGTADLDLAQRLATHGFQSVSLGTSVSAPHDCLERQRLSTLVRARDGERVYWRHKRAGYHRIPFLAHAFGGIAGCLRCAPWRLPSHLAGTLWGAAFPGTLPAVDLADVQQDGASTVPYPQPDSETPPDTRRKSA